MERVLSLINKLSVQAEAKAPLADLLATTERLRSELSAEVETEQLRINDAIAVWLPVGYPGQQAGIAAKDTGDTGKESVSREKVSQQQEPAESTPAVHAEPPAAPLHRVPSPPSKIISVAEPEPVEQRREEPGVEDKTQKASHEEEKAGDADEEIPQYLQVHLTGEDPDPVIPARFAGAESKQPNKPVQTPAESRRYPEAESAKQQVFVSPPAEKPKPEPEPVKSPQRPFPQYPDDAESLMKKIFPVSSPPNTPPKEINEFVVDPTVQLNQKLQEKKVELGEVLGTGPKISDIRKAISINDKYQMISSLFRNDENMFERSIRTLNNFGSLAEARYWMQRELVLKLAWDEKDELVQQFYRLVSRRFASI